MHSNRLLTDFMVTVEKITFVHAARVKYLQLGFSVLVAERVIGPSPIGVGVAEPLTVLSAIFCGLF